MVRTPDNWEAESRKSPEYQGKTAQKLAQYGLSLLDFETEKSKIAEGVTEELKCTRQMEWEHRCNNIHNREEEIVLHEIIYL